MVPDEKGFKSFLSIIADVAKTEDHKKQQNAYNIFQILGIEEKEVLICRFLGYLLNVNIDKSAGSRPLSLFLKNVLNVNHSVKEGAKAELEAVIDDHRRVDIVIRNGEHVYPIEVKIGAVDQKAQLYDYYAYFFGAYEPQDNRIYYLTPLGKEPSKDSIQSSDGKDSLQETAVKSISFAEEIEKWLEDLINERDMISEDFRAMVQQFLEVIVDMSNQSKTENAILKAIDLENENEFQVTPELKALVYLLQANGGTNGTIQRHIQRAYLRKYLKYNKHSEDKYEIIDQPEDLEQKSKDSHAILYIREKTDTKRIIASVCIDTNLYLRCETGRTLLKWNNRNWTYIMPKDHHGKYRLDDCCNIVEKELSVIDITQELAEITEQSEG